jgi:hypothetical protein
MLPERGGRRLVASAIIANTAPSSDVGRTLLDDLGGQCEEPRQGRLCVSCRLITRVGFSLAALAAASLDPLSSNTFTLFVLLGLAH